MNSLSWLLYFAGILPNMQTLLVIVSTISILILLVVAVMKSDVRGSPKAVLWFISLPVTILILSMFLPNEKTVYLIAASEFGEELSKHESVSVVTEELKKSVLYQLKLLQQ